MRLAIDSRPLTKQLQICNDYSGLQLLGLECVALQEVVRSTKLSVDGLCYTIELSDRRWIDPMVEGLKLLLSMQPGLCRGPFKSLRTVRTKSLGFDLILDKPIKGFESALNLPNWVAAQQGRPIRQNRLKADGHDRWILKNASHQTLHSVTLVDSPSSNDALFERGLIDITADTAVPMRALGDSLVEDTGLWVALVFNPSFNEEDKRAEVLKSLSDWSRPEGQKVFEVLANTSRPSDRFLRHNRSEGRELSIAYDPFSPNLEICWRIQSQLENQGFKVKLIQDSFYNPCYPGDMKLQLLRPKVPSELFWTYSLLDLANTPQSLHGVREKIRQIECGQAASKFEWVEELQMGKALFSLPSVYRSRVSEANPLIRNLRRAKVIA
jgi:hypothetical protein